jgi:hypothetical protein
MLDPLVNPCLFSVDLFITVHENQICDLELYVVQLQHTSGHLALMAKQNMSFSPFLPRP